MRGWLHEADIQRRQTGVRRATGERPLVAAGLLLCLLITACDKDTLVSRSERVINTATRILPVLQSNGLDTRKAEQLKEYATLLVAAIKADNGTALGHVASCIEVLESLAADVRLIPDQGKRTLALLILAVADAALHDIADQLPAEVGRKSVSRSMVTVQQFKARSRWRCRDSKTGRFVKMDQCKANPDTTTVETFTQVSEFDPPLGPCETAQDRELGRIVSVNCDHSDAHHKH